MVKPGLKKKTGLAYQQDAKKPYWYENTLILMETSVP